MLMTSTWKWTPLSYVISTVDSVDFISNVASKIYRTRMLAEEMRAGVHLPDKDLPFYEALNDPDTRAEYIRRASTLSLSRPFETNGSVDDTDLQVLQWWSESFLKAIVNSTSKIPYGMRYLARETLAALREKFPDATPEEHASCLGRLIYYRSINPAIM